MPELPKPGQAMNGFVYQGGDPKMANSWKPLTGDAYLKSLPATALPAIPVIKAYAEGRAPMPTQAAMRNPQVMQILQMTQQYDPTFSAQDYATRLGTRKDFTSGKAAQNITAFNTVLQHLDKLHGDANALNNTNYPLWNGIANTAIDAMGDPRPGNVKIDRMAVASELVRAFRGAGGAEADIQDWQRSFDPNGSPAQLNGAIQRAVELLNGRIKALGDQYNRGMGKSQDPITLLSPEAQAVYHKLAGDQKPQGAPKPAGGKPPPQGVDPAIWQHMTPQEQSLWH